MHKIQVDRPGERFMEPVRYHRSHIILVKLSNLKLRLHRFLIPFEINAVHTVAFDQKCTDCRKNHGLFIHSVRLDKHIIQMFIKHLHLAGQVCRIKRKLPCHKPVFHRKEKHTHLECPQFFQGRAFLPEAAECLEIEPDTVGLVLIELFFQRPQPLTVNLIFRIHLNEHTENLPAVRMFHKRL